MSRTTCHPRMILDRFKAPAAGHRRACGARSTGSEASEDMLAWRKKGIALAALGRYEDALVTFEHVLSLDDKSAWIWASYADILGRLHVTRRRSPPIGAQLLSIHDSPVLRRNGSDRCPAARFCGCLVHDRRSSSFTTQRQESTQHLQASVSLDPEFLLAWLARAEVLRNTVAFRDPGILRPDARN